MFANRMLHWVLIIVFLRYLPQVVFDIRNRHRIVIESKHTKWPTSLITAMWIALMSSVFFGSPLDGSSLAWWPWCGIILISCGTCIGLTSMLALGDSYSRNIVVFSNHKLITTGIYARIRHPIRLAMALETLGAVCVSEQWLLVPLHAAFCVCLVLRSRDEDKLLIKHFGKTALQYQRRVPGFWLRTSS